MSMLTHVRTALKLWWAERRELRRRAKLRRYSKQAALDFVKQQDQFNKGWDHADVAIKALPEHTGRYHKSK